MDECDSDIDMWVKNNPRVVEIVDAQLHKPPNAPVLEPYECDDPLPPVDNTSVPGFG